MQLTTISKVHSELVMCHGVRRVEEALVAQ